MTTEQQLLKGWKKYNLFDICQPKQWKTIAVKDLKNEGYPVYGANGIIGFHNEFNHEKETLLIGCRGSCGEVHISQPKSYINGNAMCLDKLSDNISLHYLYYFLKGYNFKPIISGSTQPQITQIGLKKVEIPTPTLETQQAIVNKIESLFDEIDEGIGRLKTAAQQIQQYRQSLLKNAFNGELTKEWRSKHADTLPSANELLAQIQTTREQHHAQQLADWQTAVSQWEQNGKVGKKPNKPKATTQAVKFKDNFADLPSGWGVVKLDKIVKYITDGDHQAPPKSSNGIPFITISNIDKKDFSINFFDTFFVNEDYYNQISELRKPKKGDILYTVTGSFGIPVMVDFDKKFCFQRHIGLISPLEQISAQRWLFYILQSPQVFKQAEQLSTGTAQKTVALSSLRNFEIPYCPLAEQTQIVAILESKLTACDQLATELAKQLKKAELLKQAVLKAAFSGELRE